MQRRRIYTEEKEKVVAAVWGTELIQFIAALAILYQDDPLLQRPGAIHAILQIVLVQNSYSHAKEMNRCPPNRSDDLCLLFCLYPSSTV